MEQAKGEGQEAVYIAAIEHRLQKKITEVLNDFFEALTKINSGETSAYQGLIQEWSEKITDVFVSSLSEYYSKQAIYRDNEHGRKELPDLIKSKRTGVGTNGGA